MSGVPTSSVPMAPDAKKLLNTVLIVGIADFLLLLVLVYFAWIDRSDNAVHVLGPIHGLGFLALLALTANGALQRLWGWWFPALVLVTGGPIGSFIGEFVLRKQVREPAQP
jgi:integral membrane protein